MTEEILPQKPEKKEEVDHTIIKNEERQFPVTGVCIVTPAYTGKVTVEYFNSMIQNFNDLNHHKIPWRIICAVGDSLITRSRNTLASMALGSDCSHIVMIDDDMKLPPWAVRKLLYNDKAVVGVAYKTRKHDSPKYTCSFLDNKTEFMIEGKTGCMKARNVATGCICIHRSVFENLKKFVPKYAIEESFNQFNDHNYAYFDTGIDDGKYWGEDFKFCKLCREQLSLDVWLDTSFTPGHVGNIVIEGDIRQLFRPAEPGQGVANGEVLRAQG